MQSYNSFNNNNSFDKTTVTYDYSTPEAQSSLVTKVFLTMFVSLLITAALSFGFAYAFVAAYNAGYDIILDIMIGTTVVSGLGLLIMAIVMPITMINGKRSILPSYVVYIVFMSIFLSSLFVSYDLSILGITFALTAGVFGIMAFLGYVSKGSLKGIGLVLIGLLSGYLFLSLVNIFLQSEEVYWVVSFVLFSAILFITMWDVRRIKDIAQRGYRNKNIVIYCSYMLYLDFINIFVRLLSYISRFSKRR